MKNIKKSCYAIGRMSMKKPCHTLEPIRTCARTWCIKMNGQKSGQIRSSECENCNLEGNFDGERKKRKNGRQNDTKKNCKKRKACDNKIPWNWMKVVHLSPRLRFVSNFISFSSMHFRQNSPGRRNSQDNKLFNQK